MNRLVKRKAYNKGVLSFCSDPITKGGLKWMADDIIIFIKSLNPLWVGDYEGGCVLDVGGRKITLSLGGIRVDGVGVSLGWVGWDDIISVSFEYFHSLLFGSTEIIGFTIRFLEKRSGDYSEICLEV